MKHRSHKTKFGAGVDGDRMMLRKMAYNFMKSGRMVTTMKRARALQSYVEILVQKTRSESDANKNFLLKKLGSPALIKTMYSQIAPALKDKTSGFIKLTKMHSRVSDGAAMAEIHWGIPVVMEEPKKEVKVPVTTKEAAKAEVKKEAKPARKATK